MNARVIVGLIFLGLSTHALAGPACVKEKNPCDPNLLCTFKAEWHSKALVYTIYATNDPSRKGKKAADGITYDGTYYNSSMAEAGNDKQKAADIFQEKVKKLAPSLFDMPECELNGKLDDLHRVKDGYDGMHTDEKCIVHVDYNGGDYDPGSFGSSDHVCDEFYSRDFAHEQIHRNACLAVKTPAQAAARHEIGNVIKEELKAYENSMKLAEAHYKTLMAQCSNQFPNQESVREQSKKINNLLKGLESRIKQ